MSVLIVVESCFGNTMAIARSIAAGLGDVDVTVLRPDEAPDAIPAEVQLLLAGAPTHNLSLPTATSRRKAADLGSEPAGRGLADWLAAVEPRADLDVHTFDTVVAGPFSGSAARSAAKLLTRRGFRAERGESFVVTGSKGPLRDGETERALAWGTRLAAGR